MREGREGTISHRVAVVVTDAMTPAGKKERYRPFRSALK